MRSRARPTFLCALLVAVLLSVSPASWLGWTRDVADVVRVPIMPISRAGTSLAAWLRPPRDLDGRPVGEVEIDLLRSERDHFERLWQQQLVRADDLARRLRHLEGLPDEALRSPRPPLVVHVDVTGRDPVDPRSPIELRQPFEAQGRLAVGDVAVWNGCCIVGRLAHVSGMRALVLPLVNAEAGPFEVIAVHGDLVPRLVLRQDSAGRFLADVDRRIEIPPGTRLVMADDRWPGWSHGLEVAVVESVSDIDEAPLRRRLVARPSVDVPAVARMAILSGAAPMADGTSQGAEP